VLSVAVGGAVGLALSWRAPLALAALGGWNLGSLVLLSLAWVHIGRSDQAQTRAHASADDPGRTAVYILVVLTSAVSLFAATILSGRAHAIAGESEAALIALCLVAVAVAWVLTQTSFTLRYAHLHYREDGEGRGGVQFPGGAAPAYLDFAYFAFTIGMCFQVSDCAVTSSSIRRAVLMHAALSFAYNTIILAFVLNLVFGAAVH
jgi:uncharacterized membrane protein